MSEGRAHVELSLEVGSEPIAGEVAVGVDRPERFSGWVELAAAIESARCGPATVTAGSATGAAKVQGAPLV